MNWLDLGIALFAVLLIFIGLKKGFMTSLLSHFSFSLNCILSFFLCKPIALFYNNVCGLGGAISSSYSSKLLSASADFGKNLLDFSSSRQLSSFVSKTIDKSPFGDLTEGLFKLFVNKPSLYKTLHNSNHSTRTLADIMSQSFATFFVSIISFVTCFILLYIIIWLFQKLVNKLRTVGFVKFVDNFLGCLYGLFRCLIILIILGLAIKLISPFTFMNSITAYIKDSFFGNLIYGQISSFFDNYLSFSDIVNAIFK